MSLDSGNALRAVDRVFSRVLLSLVTVDEKHAAAANDYLMSKGIIIRMVANYGLGEYLRISIGLEEDNREVIKTLKEFLG